MRVKCGFLRHGCDPDSKFNKEQLRKGIKVEKEHTRQVYFAKMIAKAHLAENAGYYDNKLFKTELRRRN